jgi:hypothetical protein
MLKSTVLAAVLAVGFLSSASAATQQYHAIMNGKSEVPPTTSAGTGTASATLDTSTRELKYTVTFENLSGPATAAHFHGPAAKGANAPVVVPIGGPNPTSPVSGTATLTEQQMKDLQAGKWYVNVHTAANKGGEIRGQVLHHPLPKGHSSAAAKKPAHG